MLPGGDFIPREEVNALVDRVAESTRREFSSALAVVQVQIGATEKTLTQKISGLKSWGLVAFLGGQTLAGLVAAYVGPTKAAAATLDAVRSIFT